MINGATKNDKLSISPLQPVPYNQWKGQKKSKDKTRDLRTRYKGFQRRKESKVEIAGSPESIETTVKISEVKREVRPSGESRDLMYHITFSSYLLQEPILEASMVTMALLSTLLS